MPKAQLCRPSAGRECHNKTTDPSGRCRHHRFLDEENSKTRSVPTAPTLAKHAIETSKHYYPEAMAHSKTGLTAPEGWTFLSEPTIPEIADVVLVKEENDMREQAVHINLAERSILVEARPVGHSLLDADYNIKSDERTIKGDTDKDVVFIAANAEIDKMILEVMSQAHPSVSSFNEIKTQIEQWEDTEDRNVDALAAYAEMNGYSYPEHAKDIYVMGAMQHVGSYNSWDSFAKEQLAAAGLPTTDKDVADKITELQATHRENRYHFFAV